MKEATLLTKSYTTWPGTAVLLLSFNVIVFVLIVEVVIFSLNVMHTQGVVEMLVPPVPGYVLAMLAAVVSTVKLKIELKGPLFPVSQPPPRELSAARTCHVYCPSGSELKGVNVDCPPQIFQIMQFGQSCH